MDERTQEIVAMIRASEGKTEHSTYQLLTDTQLAGIVEKGGFKEIQNIYDAGWRKEPINPVAQINVAIDEKGNLKDYAVFDKDKVMCVYDYVKLVEHKAKQKLAEDFMERISVAFATYSDLDRIDKYSIFEWMKDAFDGCGIELHNKGGKIE